MIRKDNDRRSEMKECFSLIRLVSQTAAARAIAGERCRGRSLADLKPAIEQRITVKASSSGPGSECSALPGAEGRYDFEHDRTQADS